MPESLSSPSPSGDSIFRLLAMYPAATSLLAAFMTLSFYFIYRALLPKPVSNIPYNPVAGRSILGDIPALLRVVPKTREAGTFLADQLRQLNSPIAQVFLRPGFSNKGFVLMADARETEDLLLRRGREFDRSARFAETLGAFSPHHHIVRPTDAQFRAQRKLLTDLMAPPFLHGVAAPNIYASAGLLVDLWREKAAGAKGRPFDATMDVFHAGMDAVLEFTFGSSFAPRGVKPQLEMLRAQGARKDEDGQLLDLDKPVVFPEAPLDRALVSTFKATAFIEVLNGSPWPRLTWWFHRKRPSLRQIARDKQEFIKTEIDKAVDRMRREDQVANGAEGITDHWVKSAVDLVVSREKRFAEKEGRKPDYWSPVVVDEVFGIVVAGHDTTSTTVTWGIKLLADHQRVQAKLRDTFRAAYAAAASEKRSPSAAEILHTSIPYLDACLEEILRVGSTIGIHIRDATEDTMLLGHRIPKGTSVYMFTGSASFLEPAFQIDESLRSPSSQLAAKEKGVRQWNDNDRALFVPERWLVPVRGERNEANGDGGTEVEFDPAAGPSLPFGLGVRGCFGRRLAYMELRILFTLIVWNFELQLCPAELSSYRAIDGLTHKPQQCFLRLRALDMS